MIPLRHLSYVPCFAKLYKTVPKLYQKGHVRFCIIILSIVYIKNGNSKIKNYNRSKTESLRLLWDIIVFRLVA